MGWMDGRSDCYGLSVRTANGTPCCSATLVYHVCRAASVSRACLAGAHALDSCASVQSGHAALLLLRATPFPVCQSFCAHVVSCIFPVLSFDVGMLPVVCCMRCGFSAFVACDVVILLFPCCMQKPPLGGARGAVPGPSLPPAAWSFGPLRRASGKYLTRHLTPLSTCQHACMIHDPCLDCILPLNTCELMVHLPFHAPNRQGRPSGLKHQEGLVFPSSPQGVSKGFSLVTPGQGVSRTDIRV